MRFIIDAWQTQLEAAGALWGYALLAAFVSMCMDSAKPKAEPGEEEKENEGGRNILMLASLLTPFLLFAHACWVTTQQSRMDVLTALIAAISTIGIVVLVSSIVGWIIAAVAPSFGRVLYKAAPWVALPVLLFTLYVTWASALSVINVYILRHGTSA